MPFPNNPNPGDSYTDAYGTVWKYAGPINKWYRYSVVPGNETTYTGGGGGSATATGNAGEIQYTDGTNLAASPNLLWDNANSELEVTGDLQLKDGGTYTTTLQTITPTANRTVSIPDATGTLALVAGTSGQLLWNNAGANAGVSTLTYDGSILTSSGRFINSYNAAGIASAPAKAWTGTWFTTGTATTTKPHVLIEPTGTTSTGWSTSGTGLGVNAASGFAGNLLDLQVNGSPRGGVSSAGAVYGTSVSLLLSGFALDGNAPTLWRKTTGEFYYGTQSQTKFGYIGANISIGSGGAYSWGVDSEDLFLRRDAANTLAQRNGTNAQVFRVYNTYTSSTNYELGKLEWNSNVFRIGTEKGSGGGTARTVEVHTDSIARLALDTTGSVRVVTGLTVATLPGTPAVGMIARVTDATAPVVGVTVAGGGAAAALVWYNGTNWTVIGV